MSLVEREQRIFRSEPVPDREISLRKSEIVGVNGYDWERLKPRRIMKIEIPCPDQKCSRCRPPAVFFPEERQLTIHEIQSAACAFFRIRRVDLLGERRTPDVVWPRHVAIWLVKNLTMYSLPQIGRHFRRDHTTAMYAIRKINKLVESDERTRTAILSIARMLGIPKFEI